MTGKLAPGRNVIAVKVSPPPHPGLAHEESMTAGVGENGGMQMLDGPTFVATEGLGLDPVDPRPQYRSVARRRPDRDRPRRTRRCAGRHDVAQCRQQRRERRDHGPRP
ncbi:hypothetical protein QP185_20500 [Sphingomonas aerolata]|uniref:hypothetical protein n=1 Tax=Sphingomonas aerolata TaxID=185951 RepID=UPI002FE0E3CB